MKIYNVGDDVEDDIVSETLEHHKFEPLIQCVTIPKIWTKPSPIFYRYQIFQLPNPILFSIPKNFSTESYTLFNFDTESETIQKMEKFLNREASKPKCHT